MSSITASLPPSGSALELESSGLHLLETAELFDLTGIAGALVEITTYARTANPTPISSFTTRNEPGNSNRRGTVAIAKLGSSDPNGATSQFFFSLAETASILTLRIMDSLCLPKCWAMAWTH